MPVDAAGNPYTIDPKTGQMLPVNGQGQAAQPYQYGASPLFGPTRTPQGSAPAGAPASAGGQFQIDPSQNPTDPAYVAKYVQWLSQQPGADPSLASDPNYWVQKIIENGGGVNTQNIGYWNNRSKAGAGDAGAGGAAGTSPYGTNGFMGSPGYAYEQKAAQDAVQASAAARGTLLTTGTMKDLQGTAAGIAGQAFGLDSSNLLQLAGIGQNATNNAGSYITAGANANATGQINSANAQMAGANNFNNAVQTGYNNGQFPGQSGTNGPNMQPQGPGYASNAANTTQNYIYARNNIAGSNEEDDPTGGG